MQHWHTPFKSNALGEVAASLQSLHLKSTIGRVLDETTAVNLQRRSYSDDAACKNRLCKRIIVSCAVGKQQLRRRSVPQQVVPDERSSVLSTSRALHSAKTRVRSIRMFFWLSILAECARFGLVMSQRMQSLKRCSTYDLFINCQVHRVIRPKLRIWIQPDRSPHRSKADPDPVRNAFGKSRFHCFWTRLVHP